MMKLKSKSEIEIMSKGGEILSYILKDLSQQVKPGVTGLDLEKRAHQLMEKFNVTPSFLGYDNFPAALCVSVNEGAVHCPPTDEAFQKNDLVSLDMGVFYQGWHTDSAVTVIVEGKSKLLTVCKESLQRAIQIVKIGNKMSDIGKVVQEYVEKNHFKVIRELCGHGIGRDLHEYPDILNIKNNIDIPFENGMVFCIEPIITSGNGKIISSQSGIRTKDKKPCAHFEHMVAIIDGKGKILT
jgi:methionyl aminopeptidase